MKTRFSLELHLDEAERMRLFQVFEYLAEFHGGMAILRRELADFLVGAEACVDLAEAHFLKLIGIGTPGFEIEAIQNNAVRIYDTDGDPNLRMLCQIIANVVPRVMPLEFSFALVDEAEHRFSGGLAVMSAGSAEIRTIDTMIARRSGVLLH